MTIKFFNFNKFNFIKYLNKSPFKDIFEVLIKLHITRLYEHRGNWTKSQHIRSTKTSTFDKRAKRFSIPCWVPVVNERNIIKKSIWNRIGSCLYFCQAHREVRMENDIKGKRCWDIEQSEAKQYHWLKFQIKAI